MKEPAAQRQRSQLVVVPMKPAYEAKSRLSDVMDSHARAALSLLLLDHVLKSIAGAVNRFETLVVGGDCWVKSVAEGVGARWVPEPGAGLNAAVRLGYGIAESDGARAVLVLPGDLGLLDSQEVDGIVDSSRGLRSAVLARAETDGGTNALLAGPGLPIDPCFGPRSFERHLMAARMSGTPVELWSSPGVSFDLDTVEDLEVFRAARPDLEGQMRPWIRRLLSPMVARGS